jgi:hypothetical protein
MTCPGRQAVRARLRSDAPDVYHLAPGAWYDVLGDDVTQARPDGRLLLRPADAVADDAESYIPLARSMVELSRRDGSRLLVDAAGARWLAAVVPLDQCECATHWLRFVSESGAYAVLPCLSATLDELSDDELLGILGSYYRATEHPDRPRGLRFEARVRPAFAWGYRMLDPAVWYLIESRWTTEHAIVIVTVDGDRVVDTGHFEVRTFLD